MMTTCENCDGEGGIFSWMTRYDGDYGKWDNCPQCNGSGWARGEGDPIDIDDLPPPRSEP